jgi:folate-binding protein YgfZ
VSDSGETSSPLTGLALGELHERLGARFAAEGRTAVPADYGEGAAELAALGGTHGIVDLSWGGRLELRGRDRQRFLNGLVTSNARDLGAGHGSYGFFLDRQGRVLADVYVTALEDRLWLELPAGTGEAIRRHLESHRVIDDVEVAGLDDMAVLGVLGPGAAGALGDRAIALALDATARVTLEGCEVQLTRRSVFGVEGFVLWVPSSLAEDVFVALAAGGRAVGLAALDARRVELGVGRFGVDFGPATIANETGLLEQAIDFTKGCYLGQEIVARIFYKGKPSQPVLPLVVRGRRQAPVVPCGIHRVVDERPDGTCGALTSVCADSAPGDWLAIGNVSRRALDEAAPLALEGGGEVRVRSLAG